MAQISGIYFDDAVTSLFKPVADRAGLELQKLPSGIYQIAGKGFVVRMRRGTGHLKEVLVTLAPATDDAPIHNGHCCSLLELSEQSCRWPISTPGAADFCFCGNTPVEGLPYCPGHSRLAYQPGSRQRVARG